ncbi:MAG: hypothetical protein HYT75_06985 [Deltaproteobacteria bacterium]|nr:hypothetical protein [Deltaproteobacteria bacterium]MBI2341303.1 hypothetical protein [Deltaproteobacteria bacterium]
MAVISSGVEDNNLQMSVSAYATEPLGQCRQVDIPYPTCQVGDVTYVDVDISGEFIGHPDFAVDVYGNVLTDPETKKLTSNFTSESYFYLSKCFYDSAKSFLDHEAIGIRHGLWPDNFTVITSAKGDELAATSSLLYELANHLSMAQDPEHSKTIISQFAMSVALYAEVTVRISLRPSLYDRVPITFHTDGRIGKVQGWLYNPASVERDAQNRYLIVIRANLGNEDGDNDSDDFLSTKEFSEMISQKYNIPDDHIVFITPPLSKDSIKDGIKSVVSRIPTDSAAEVGIVYNAHGGPDEEKPQEWMTTLHEGWFYGLLGNVTLGEKEFRELLISNLSTSKIFSVLLLVDSCHSGMLVEE